MSKGGIAALMEGVSPPPEPPAFLGDVSLIELPLKEETNTDESSKKIRRSRTKKESPKKMSLAVFLNDRKKEQPKKTPTLIFAHCVKYARDVLGVLMMQMIVQNTFKNVTNGLLDQLDQTVKGIVKLRPTFALDNKTCPRVINQLVDMVISPGVANGLLLYEMLRSILAIHGFLSMLSEFKSLTLQVSSKMCSDALDYIKKNANSEGDFDATEFFLNKVPLDQRCDAIAALLCIAHCVCVVPNRKMGPHRFIVVMKVCPRFVKRVLNFIATTKYPSTHVQRRSMPL